MQDSGQGVAGRSRAEDRETPRLARLVFLSDLSAGSDAALRYTRSPSPTALDARITVFHCDYDGQPDAE